MAFIDQIRLSESELAEAQDYVRARAYNRAFLSKMAQLGFTTQNADEQQTLLELDLRLQAQSEASQTRNRYKKAAEKLLPADRAQRQAASGDEAIKIAQYLAAEDPDLYGAALGVRIEFERAQGAI